MVKSIIRDKRPLSIVVIGASGDLAMRKIYPALFSLYTQKLLPEHFHVVGYARSEMTNEDFRERVSKNLPCRYHGEKDCGELMARFVARCTYVSGSYSDPEAYKALQKELSHLEETGADNRIFYMSIPPFLFLEVARALNAAGQLNRGDGWSRVVIEKPFGSDRDSSDELTESMAQVFTEDQTFRIDHYLGKEVIQNLMVLRFANLIFDPVWNSAYVESVRISWTETLGLEGRAGYFDEYGIIRDVMQNHLLQILALVAMEPPINYDHSAVRDEKVKVLKCVQPVDLEHLVVGQYTANAEEKQVGYLQEPGVPPDSITPTYAAAVMFVRNRRWDGVPFLVRAGKALDCSMTEIRIRFKKVPGNIYQATTALANNELIIRVQPDASIALRILNKVPGLRLAIDETKLDLQYSSAYSGVIPEAYESLILDVIRGDRSLFIRADELAAAWDVFTPVLHELEQKNVKPRSYAFGGRGPEAAVQLAARYGVSW